MQLLLIIPTYMNIKRNNSLRAVNDGTSPILQVTEWKGVPRQMGLVLLSFSNHRFTNRVFKVEEVLSRARQSYHKRNEVMDVITTSNIISYLVL